ncbi:hypothetical protein L9F63_004707 [Diploptera punctata]|uniref:Uncharacterized protein n=1 Tax=Diploptera punctata TaxID=6984 RepID=A0AAD8E754_DIPPU|nr:hypothetical protein L9F63_004707 [Diploptera punctata]
MEHELVQTMKSRSNFPCGPAYRSIHKKLAAIHLDSPNEDEGIEQLVESHASSLHMRIYLKYDKSRYENNGMSHVLDGKLVQPRSVPMLDRLYDMPEEWTLIQISYAYDHMSRFQAINKEKSKNPDALHIVRFVCGEKARHQTPYCINGSNSRGASHTSCRALLCYP